MFLPAFQLCGRGAIDGGGSPPPGPPPVVTSVTLDNTTPTVGDTITATATGTDCDSFTYVWKADGVTIGGETASTYTATRADAMGKALTCEATGHNAGGDSSAVASGATALVTGAPVNVSPPVPSALADYAATTTDGTWSAYPAPTFTYLWNLDPFPTSQGYTWDSSFENSAALVTVTATNDIGSSSRMSDAAATLHA